MTFNRWAVLFLAVGLAANACNCDEAPVTSVCAVDADCPEDQHCDQGTCRPGERVCQRGLFEENCRRCEEDADCPQGARCARSGMCIPPECETDDDCDRAAREICVTKPSGWRVCEPFRCDTDNECEERWPCEDGFLAVCIANGCRCRNPCGGECPTDEVCCGAVANADYGNCLPDPGACPDTDCGLGYQTVVVEEGAWSLPLCRRDGDQCRCEELPPLPMGDYGIHSALAGYGSQAVVAAYNSTYGDLMVGFTGGDDMSPLWQYVDGVPEASLDTVTGGPSGPRDGVSTQGANVGRYPAIVVAPNATVHLVYQDADNDDVVYARSLCGLGCEAPEQCDEGGSCSEPDETCTPRCNPGQACFAGACVSAGKPNRFKRMVLDADGEAGLYNAIALSAAGAPIIYTAVARVSLDGVPSAELRIYQSAFAEPETADDFTTHLGRDQGSGMVASLADIACQGGCPDDTVCVAPNAQCIPSAEGCDPACADTEACTRNGCQTTFPDPPRLGPAVVNAFNVLERTASDQIAGGWYDRVRDRVMLFTEGNPPMPVQVAGGEFMTLVIQGTLRHIAFIKDEQLHYVKSASDGTVLEHLLVDDGVRRGEGFAEVRVLAEPAIDQSPDGSITLFYQDATAQDVLVARRAPREAEFTVDDEALLGDDDPYAGSFGFANRAARNADAAWFSTYRIFLDEEDANRLVLLER
jgi:hypothetical protein